MRVLTVFDRTERGRLIRFVVVGGSSTAVTLAIYGAAIELGIPYLIGGAGGYGAGILNGYTWNRIWTFEAGPFHLPEFSRYVVVQAGGMLANAIGLTFAIEVLGLGKFTAEIVTLFPIVIATYFANRRWTFGPRVEAGSPAPGD